MLPLFRKCIYVEPCPNVDFLCYCMPHLKAVVFIVMSIGQPCKTFAAYQEWKGCRITLARIGIFTRLNQIIITLWFQTAKVKDVTCSLVVDYECEWVASCCQPMGMPDSWKGCSTRRIGQGKCQLSLWCLVFVSSFLVWMDHPFPVVRESWLKHGKVGICKE